MFFKKKKQKNTTNKSNKNVQNEADESILAASLIKTKKMNKNSSDQSNKKEYRVKSRSNSTDLLRRILYCGGSCYSKSSQGVLSSDSAIATNASNPLLSKINDDEQGSNQHDLLNRNEHKKLNSNHHLFFNRIKKENLKENLIGKENTNEQTDNNQLKKVSPNNFESLNSDKHSNTNISKQKLIPILKVNDDLIVENSNDDFQLENDENEEVLLENESVDDDLQEVDEDEYEKCLCESRTNSSQLIDGEGKELPEHVQLGADDAKRSQFEQANVKFLNNLDLDENEDVENKFVSLRNYSPKFKLKLSESAHLTSVQSAVDTSNNNKIRPEAYTGFKATIQHLSSSPLFECKTNNNLGVENDVSMQKTGSLINFFNDKMKQHEHEHEHEQLKCEKTFSKYSIFSSSIRNSLDEFDINSESSYDSNILVPLLLLNKRKKSNVSKIDENEESFHVNINKFIFTETSTERTDEKSSECIREKSASLLEKQTSIVSYEENNNNPHFVRAISNDSNDVISNRYLKSPIL